MKFFLDTSVLVAAFLEDHVHHEASFRVFLRADKKHACCAAQSLSEVYSVLTRLPGRHRLSGDQALLFLQSIRERLAIISLEAADFFAAIEAAANGGIVGGAIYDAVLAQCALHAKAETIYTWNLGHFQRLHPEIARRVRTP